MVLKQLSGFQGMTQTNQNKGNEYVVPNYFSQDAGAFAYVKKTIKKFTMNAGIRYDYRNINGKPLNLNSNGGPIQEATPFFRTFQKLVFRLSPALWAALLDLHKILNAKINIGRVSRAPNIYRRTSPTSMNRRCAKKLEFDAGETESETRNKFTD